MATYLELHDTIYASPEIEKRLTVACLMAADTVLHEAASTPNHELRTNFARAVLSNPTASARKLMPAIMTNPDYADSIFTDADLLWLVSFVLEIYAPMM